MTRRASPRAVLALACLVASGCSPGLDTSYGHLRGASVNGTGAFAEMLRGRGHEVRAAVRLTDELNDWADVIVRFAPYPGPPEQEEAGWYARWLDEGPERSLVYIPYDYNALADYWSDVLAHLPKDAAASLRTRAEKLRDRAKAWTDHIPRRPKEVAGATDWFAVIPASRPPAPCKRLQGPWADGVDASQAAVPVHETLKVDAETVLLACGKDKEALAMEWTRYKGSQVLVLANASFLLNAALMNPARRPLAGQVVDWVGDGPQRVAFVEGLNVLGGGPEAPSIWRILERVASIRWVAVQMLVLGLAACLARAPRLGRPRPEPPSGADRPAAHAEALGALLARAGHAGDARAILDAYRRWRYPARTGQQSSFVNVPPNAPKPEAGPGPEIEFIDT
jgi:hypothetical protein